ncbi:MAG TPA: calcium-binding protein [Caulobacteraceae bacterium]|jgi:Ca2+-binding RTX toxin-like protein
MALFSTRGRLTGAPLGEFIEGDDDSDYLIGTQDADTIRSGAGNDTLIGLEGADKLVGGKGNDVFRGDQGDDTFAGGAGDDVATLYVPSAQKLDLSGFVPGATTILDDLHGGADKLISIERINVYASSGNDVITGCVTRNRIDTGGGNDRIDGAGGNDTIDDYRGNSTLIGGVGDDLITVSDDFDWADNQAHGGHDQIDGGAGLDALCLYWQALTGEVTLTWSGGRAHASSADGAFTVDTVRVENIKVLTQGATVTLNGGQGDDTLSAGSGANQIDGGGGNDLLSGLGSLDGGDGNDTLQSYGGNDSVSGGAGADTYAVYAGSYNGGGVSVDFSAFDISGGDQTVSDFGGGTDSLTGIEAVQVETGQGNDTLIGSAGDDRLYDSHGTDVIDAGAGDDLVGITDWNWWPDWSGMITDDNDTISGGSGADTLSLASLRDTRFYQRAPGFVVDLAHGLLSSDYTKPDTISGFEHAIGGTAGDTITGAAIGETLEGAGGDDIILGGRGDDVIGGGAGADRLNGGAGADRFVYLALDDSSADAADRVVGLDSGDQIDLRAIDADVALAGDQAFHLNAGASRFSDAHDNGELILRYDSGRDVTYIKADVDGDNVADLVITLDGKHKDFAAFVL